VLVTVRAVVTNDLGEYRLFWLPPGEYLVGATLLGANAPSNDFELIPGGIARRVIGPSSGESIELPNDDAAVPFYFPGTTDPARAEALVLQPGTVRSSVNFNIVATMARRVRGVVLNLPGPSPAQTSQGPLNQTLRIRLEPRTLSAASESAPTAFAPI